MAERSDQRTREPSDAVDIDGLTDSDEDTTSRTVDPESTGRLERLRRKTGSVFSMRSFAVAVLTTLIGAVAFGMAIPFFGSIAALGGIFAAAFAYGAVGSRSRYLEVGLAGGSIATLGALLEFLTVAFLGGSQLLLVFGAGSGLLAAVVGHYFGRDLRQGMTQDI